MIYNLNHVCEIYQFEKQMVDNYDHHGGAVAFYCLGQRSTVDYILDLIKQLTPHCPELCNVIELLLDHDPEFCNSFAQLLTQGHNQPCTVHSLPAINMGVIGAAPHVVLLHNGLDQDSNKMWSEACTQMIEYFSPPQCGEPCLPSPLVEEDAVHSHIVRSSFCSYSCMVCHFKF